MKLSSRRALPAHKTAGVALIRWTWAIRHGYTVVDGTGWGGRQFAFYTAVVVMAPVAVYRRRQRATSVKLRRMWERARARTKRLRKLANDVVAVVALLCAASAAESLMKTPNRHSDDVSTRSYTRGGALPVRLFPSPAKSSLFIADLHDDTDAPMITRRTYECLRHTLHTLRSTHDVSPTPPSPATANLQGTWRRVG